MAVVLLVQSAVFSRYRWPLISEVYEIAQAPYLARAIIRTMLRPREAKFNVTAKDETLAEDYISPIHGPLLGLFLLVLAGVVALVARWIAFPGDRSVLSVVGVWAVINLLLVSLSLRAVSEKQQRRAAPRVFLRLPASANWAGSGSTPVQATVLDVSTSGASLRLEHAPRGIGSVMVRQGDEISFRPVFANAPHLEQDVRAVVLALSSKAGEGTTLGLRLVGDQPVAVQEAVAQMIFGDSEVWRAQREATRQGKGLIAGLAYVIGLTLASIPRTARDYLREPERRRRVASNAHRSARPAHLMAFGADFDAVEHRSQSMPVPIEDFIEIEARG
ncbi:MAG: hypothetical protein QM682_17600 [Paracoccus sp. (in: a-proteobacteria)]